MYLSAVSLEVIMCGSHGQYFFGFPFIDWPVTCAGLWGKPSPNIIILQGGGGGVAVWILG